jgi:hypothetical protein
MLEDIIPYLEKEEVRYYKLMAQRTYPKDDRKDLSLFDAIRQGRAYTHVNPNALYRLRNRVFSDLNTSLFVQHLEEDSSYIALQYLFLARLFRARQAFSIAHKYLRKALRLAGKKDDPSILIILYSELITLSHDLPDIDLKHYIELRKKAEESLREIQDIDNVLALLTHRVNTTQSFSPKNVTLKEELEQLITRYADPEKIEGSLQLRLKVYRGVSHLLLRRKAYKEMEGYLSQTYKTFQEEGLFDRDTHDIKLEMIIYRINCLFKLNRYSESLTQAELLKNELEAYQGMLRNAYRFYLYNARIINYSALDPEHALEILKEALEDPVINDNAQHHIYLQVSRTQLLHELGRVQEALRQIAVLVNSRSLDDMPESYTMKVELAEMMIRFEKKDFDQLEKMIPSWKQRHQASLESDEFQRERLVLQILSLIMYNLDADQKTAARNLTEELLDLADESTAEDTDVLNYVRWIKKNVTKLL